MHPTHRETTNQMQQLAEQVKQADNIIDLGPQGGDSGGKIIYQGSPENIVKNRKSFTGKYLLRYT